MTPWRWGPGARAREAFAGQGAATQAHVALRWWSCPFPVVAAEVPRVGRVLDVGCGHGLLAVLLALDSPARSVVGMDVDGPKLDAGRTAATRAGLGSKRLRFEAAGDPPRLPEGPWDAVVVVDVLYLLPPEAQREVLVQAASSVAPGGVVVVKEMGPDPARKAAWNRLQETLAVQVVGITAGDELVFRDPAEHAADLGGAGLRTEVRRVDRGYPHPHTLVVGRRG